MTGLVGRIEGSGSGESGPGDSGKVALLQRAVYRESRAALGAGFRAAR